MELTIAFCGDIMLGAEVGERIGSATIGDWLTDVSDAWSGADLLIGNLESPCVVERALVNSLWSTRFDSARLYRNGDMFRMAADGSSGA
jgi:Bacterial capsule synthesis protein PGA_cap